MKVDILPSVLLMCALSISGGAWIGYRMSVAARAVLRQTPTAPPVEGAASMPEVGELYTGEIHLRPTIIYGRKPRFWASVLPTMPAPSAEPQFFDFKHSYCDEVEAVHGRVLRCQKLPR